MSEETLYKSIRESVLNYAPEVPAEVYGGMRRKLWWSRFLAFDAHRMNVWYLALLLAVSGIALGRIGASGEANGAAFRECAVQSHLSPSVSPVSEGQATVQPDATHQAEKVIVRNTPANPSAAPSESAETTRTADQMPSDETVHVAPAADSADGQHQMGTVNEQTKADPDAQPKKGRALRVTRYLDKD